MSKLTTEQLAAIGNIVAIARQHQLPPLLLGMAHATSSSYSTVLGNSGAHGYTTSLIAYTRKHNNKARGITIRAIEPNTDNHTATRLSKGDSVYIAALTKRLGQNELTTLVIHSQPLPKHTGKQTNNEEAAA